MSYATEDVLQEWLGNLKGLDVEVKKIFGCHCLYCDGQAVGWIHDTILNLREVGLDYLPKDIKRPNKTDRVHELVPLTMLLLNGFHVPFKIPQTSEKEMHNQHGVHCKRYLRNGGEKEVSPQERGKKTHCSI